jgi:ABC-2 type transport system ATP-binding protein
MDALRCEGLTGRRRAAAGRPAVDRLDLRVGEGEVVGLVGGAGAGKTSLLCLLTGLARPAAGAAWVLGSPLPCPERLAEVGAMIGRPGAHAWLTGRAQLEVLLRCGPPGPPGAVDRALRLTGLRRLADRRVGTWAAPARRRLALAAALLRGPRLLLLDEPVAGLDADGTARVTTLLGDLAGEGVSVLIAARRLGALAPLCTRVAVLDRGRLVDDRPAGAEPRWPVEAGGAAGRR